MSTRANYLVFDLLDDLCFGANFGTKEPGDNKLKDVPDAFDVFLKFNYPVYLPILAHRYYSATDPR